MLTIMVHHYYYSVYYKLQIENKGTQKRCTQSLNSAGGPCMRPSYSPGVCVTYAGENQQNFVPTCVCACIARKH